jgi:TPP-dependent 2-oxoacid decarboxylase
MIARLSTCCTHTLGTHDFNYQLEIAKKLTSAAVSITSPEDAPSQIDHAIRTACARRSPPTCRERIPGTWAAVPNRLTLPQLCQNYMQLSIQSVKSTG